VYQSDPKYVNSQQMHFNYLIFIYLCIYIFWITKGYLMNRTAKYTGLATLWLQISSVRHVTTTRNQFLSEAHSAEHAPTHRQRDRQTDRQTAIC
jgi:hypothetical protein